MTRRLAIALVIILGVLVICAMGTGCAEPYTTDARVTAKVYRPSYAWTYLIQVGKVQIMVPVPESEHWLLVMTWTYRGRQVQSPVRVDQGTYSRAVVGSLVRIQVGVRGVDLADPGR